MRVKFYFDLGKDELIKLFIESKNEDEALAEVIRAAENGSPVLYIRGRYIALKSEVIGYGLE